MIYYINTDKVTHDIKVQFIQWTSEQKLKFNKDWGWSLFDGIWFSYLEDATAFKLRFEI